MGPETSRVAREIMRSSAGCDPGGRFPAEWRVDQSTYQRLEMEYEDAVRNFWALPTYRLPNQEMHILNVPIRVRETPK